MHSARQRLAADDRDRRGGAVRLRRLCEAVLADTLADFEGLWWESRCAARPVPAPRASHRRGQGAHRRLQDTGAVQLQAVVQRLKSF